MRPETDFLLPHEPHLARLSRVDPDREWSLFIHGERAWILQTYLYLARTSLPVRLTDVPRGPGVMVFHAKHKRWLYRYRARVGDAVLVGVRGDLREPLFADVEVLQNGCFADGRRRVFIPHWPQPGLKPRDPVRGTRTERIAYKGFHHNLHEGLRTAAWRGSLAAHGMEWRCDSVEYQHGGSGGAVSSWPDYRDIDVVVAVRPPDPRLHTAKPATKLCNAWAAGVPAILGPEYAYRELRRGDLDYLEVSSPEEALAALLRLRASPQLYLAMVENGRRRAQEFTVEATTGRWRELLVEHVPMLVRDPAFLRWHRMSLRRRHFLGRLRQLLSLRRSPGPRIAARDPNERP